MSDIKSRPYSPQGRSNWDDIFGHTDAAPVNGLLAYVANVIGLANQVSIAKTHQQVIELRVKLQELVDPMDETDRMQAFRVFNAAVPIILE